MSDPLTTGPPGGSQCLELCFYRTALICTTNDFPDIDLRVGAWGREGRLWSVYDFWHYLHQFLAKPLRKAYHPASAFISEMWIISVCTAHSLEEAEIKTPEALSAGLGTGENDHASSSYFDNSFSSPYFYGVGPYPVSLWKFESSLHQQFNYVWSPPPKALLWGEKEFFWGPETEVQGHTAHFRWSCVKFKTVLWVCLWGH